MVLYPGACRESSNVAREDEGKRWEHREDTRAERKQGAPRVMMARRVVAAVVNGIRDGDGSNWYINDERTEGHSREVGRDSS